MFNSESATLFCATMRELTPSSSDPFFLKGGEINYIGVGVYAGKYGFSVVTNAALVAGWNASQLVFGEGLHNYNQIDTGGAWAQVGHGYYNNR